MVEKSRFLLAGNTAHSKQKSYIESSLSSCLLATDKVTIDRIGIGVESQ